MNKTRASFLTMISSLANSVLLVLLNLAYNHVLIHTYGSSVNGLVSTLTQFVSFFTILEGGFTTAAIVALYKPLLEKDYKKVADILFTVKKLFFQIGLVITFLVLILGFVFIRFIDSPFSFVKTFSLLGLSLLTTFINISILSKHMILIEALNKGYLTILSIFIPKFVFKLFAIFLMLYYRVDILFIYSFNVIEIILSLMILSYYEKKFLPVIKYEGEYKISEIKGIKDVFAQKIANTVFTSTDLVLIATYISLAASSVYNLYSQIFQAVAGVLSGVLTAPFNSFGQLVNSEKGIEKARTVFNSYNNISIIISTISLASIGFMALPFIKLYTSGVTDVNYADTMLLMIYYTYAFFQAVNRPYGMILNATGNFKLQNKQCVIAAVANIIFSIILARYFGISGIILGSAIGVLIILSANIYQVYSKIFYGYKIKDVFVIVLNYLFGLVAIILSINNLLIVDGYLLFILYSIVIFVIVSVCCVLMNILLNYRDTVTSLRYFFEKVFHLFKKYTN